MGDNVILPSMREPSAGGSLFHSQNRQFLIRRTEGKEEVAPAGSIL